MSDRDDAPETSTAEAMFTDTVTDEETFAAALNTSLQAAHQNDVNLAQPYVCRNGASSPDREVETIRLQTPAEETEDG